ncbi:uncharacterized protein CTHT_0062600 [Thermochaetoides thermophila DSM 1495]|uniref:endo-1,4-beta-xylanase n=1 Tax=Chaetomium thermophilum (strain DSM 1495 / CBS 144.50 / IMI 039719) TaxID=759272 RepID=G0SE65_CHATD|nr:hypothetical protein CTHT_0062600 [Thermochaetoides thermophila DSM 1495]EGS18242.1 hypothetical protein CTHT_0062600 [Thermochaetoides thermophila DSM 1495]
MNLPLALAFFFSQDILPASAQLHWLAQQAGLVYFGAATDTPFQREREPWSAERHSRYKKIIRNPNEFGQTKPTNGQKWLFTEPYLRIFNFTETDIVTDEVARKEGKLLRCHALVWHNQLAPWVEGKEWTKEELAEAIERYHGVFIDGIGMQGHFVAENHPSAEELKETMRGYIKLVDEVAITELDVRIKLPIDEQKLQWQKEAYQKVVEACVKVRKCIGITLWDIYDPFSWVPHYFPGDREPLLWF